MLFHHHKLPRVVFKDINQRKQKQGHHSMHQFPHHIPVIWVISCYIPWESQLLIPISIYFPYPMRIPWESHENPMKNIPRTRIAWRTPSPPFVSSPPAPSCCSRAPPRRSPRRAPRRFRRGRRRSGSAACGARMRSWRSWGLEENHDWGRF